MKDFRKDDGASDDEPEIVYSHESSRSSVFDQAEFDSFETRDERVDYLLAAREKVRSSLRLREVILLGRNPVRQFLLFSLFTSYLFYNVN